MGEFKIFTVRLRHDEGNLDNPGQTERLKALNDR
jgi:hypothetical protein